MMYLTLGLRFYNQVYSPSHPVARIDNDILQVADLPNRSANRTVGPAYDTRPEYSFGIFILRYVTPNSIQPCATSNDDTITLELVRY
jgi:hypothetical protein